MADKLIDFENLTYCGNEANEIFSKDVYSIDLRSYGVQLMDGLKGKTKLYDGTIGDVWQKYVCPFTPKGEVALNESWIEPAEIKVNLEECYDVFWNTFLVEQTEISLRGGIPQTFSQWFFDKLRKKMMEEYQEIFWKGDKANGAKDYLKVIDGVEKQLNDDSSVTKATVAAFTVQNILAEVEKVIAASLDVATTQDVAVDDYKVFMNYADVRLLEVALGNVNAVYNTNGAVFSNYARQNGKIYIMGYEIVPTKQTKNTVIVGPAKNLVLGFDTYSSHTEYKLIDMRNTTGDNQFRVIAISNIAAGIVLPALFVYGKTA